MIALKGNDATEISNLKKEADQLNLLTYTVQDAGLTQVFHSFTFFLRITTRFQLKVGNYSNRTIIFPFFPWVLVS